MFSRKDELVLNLTDADSSEALTSLYRDVRSGPEGLSTREAQRRLESWGPNEVTRQRRRHWLRELATQFVHPLALLLVAAAALCLATGSRTLAIAIVAVIALNAVFAFLQEQHAEHAVEALAAFLPERARVLRDGQRVDVEARDLVVGDVIFVEEGSESALTLD